MFGDKTQYIHIMNKFLLNQLFTLVVAVMTTMKMPAVTAITTAGREARVSIIAHEEENIVSSFWRRGFIL